MNESREEEIQNNSPRDIAEYRRQFQIDVSFSCVCPVIDHEFRDTHSQSTVPACHLVDP